MHVYGNLSKKVMRTQVKVTKKQRLISMFIKLHNSKDFAIIVLCNKEQTKVLDLCKIFFVCADVFIYFLP